MKTLYKVEYYNCSSYVGAAYIITDSIKDAIIGTQPVWSDGSPKSYTDTKVHTICEIKEIINYENKETGTK